MSLQRVRRTSPRNSQIPQDRARGAQRPFAGLTRQNRQVSLAQRATENGHSHRTVERAARFGHNFADIAVHVPDQPVLAQIQPKRVIQPPSSHSEATTGNRAREVQPKNKTGLPDHLKAGIESLSGLALDEVRVHFNSEKPARLQALAYTQGTEIHVAPGQERHLPHEAWHVVQQAQGRVRPTMQLKEGVPVNHDPGLEHEAEVMGTQAWRTLLSDQAAAGSITAALTQGRQEVSPADDQSPVQRYYSAPDQNTRKLYNISNLGKFVVGIEYPNHALFARDFAMVNTLNAQLTEGMMVFEKKDSQVFQFPETNPTKYDRVYPIYKDRQTGEEIRKTVIGNAGDRQNNRQIGPDLTTILEINTTMETLRKLFTQFALFSKRLGAADLVLDLVSLYRQIYIKLWGWLNLAGGGELDVKDDIALLISHLQQYYMKTRDRSVPTTTELLEILRSRVQNLRLPANPEELKKSAHIQELSNQVTKPDPETLMMRGCDLVAGTILGKAKMVGPTLLNFNLRRMGSSVHHYATKLMSDGSDFVTIEGFAQAGFEGPDHTWEFFLHGNFSPTPAEAFEDYTRIRYSFFGSLGQTSGGDAIDPLNLKPEVNEQGPGILTEQQRNRVPGAMTGTQEFNSQNASMASGLLADYLKRQSK